MSRATRAAWWSWTLGVVLSLIAAPSFGAETWPAGTVVDTLRQGLNAYTGVDDCYLDLSAATVARGNGSTTSRLWISASGQVGLLRFDLTEGASGIPSANTVLRAVLRLTLQGTSTLYERVPYVQAMRMNRAWGDSTATWDSTGVGTAGTGDWYLGGADSTYADSLYTAGSDTLSDPPADRGAKAHASFQMGAQTGVGTALTAGTIIELDVTSMVQRWQSGAWTNFGMGLVPTFFGPDPLYWYSDTLKLAASEHATASYRPTLFVWSTDATPDTVTVGTPSVITTRYGQAIPEGVRVRQ